MTLRALYTSGPIHGRFPVDPSAMFQAGQVGQLAADAAGNPVVTLAGTKPIGLIEDNKTATFTQAVIGELHTVLVGSGTPVAVTLNHANVVSLSELSFRLSSTGVATANTRTTDYTMNYVNGILSTTVAGAINTATAYIDTDGDSTDDSINIAVNYQFAIPGVVGVDTTLASGLVSLHVMRGEFAVGVYDTAVSYAVNTQLFVGDGSTSPVGTLTVDAASTNAQVVGVVTQPPTASNPYMHVMTDFDYGTWV